MRLDPNPAPVSLSADTADNETVSPFDIMNFLDRSGFDLYADHWNEQDLYFGRHGSKVMPIDALFGSAKFDLPTSEQALREAAAAILSQPFEAATFNHGKFLRSWTDVIAVERTLSEKMKRRFLPGGGGATSSGDKEGESTNNA